MSAPHWIRRLPLGEPVRRALEETLADGLHESRAATSAWRRAARLAAIAIAIFRVLTAITRVFDEGYPMRNLGRDLRYGVRRLRAAPAFTIFSIVTLAFGIGSTTAIVSIVRSLTGPPSGVLHPEAVVDVFHSPGFNAVNGLISWADFKDYKAKQTTMSAVTAWRFTHESILANGHSESAFGEIVDGGYFTVLGIQPAVGRLLQPSDDRPSAPAVAVISDLLWRRDFGASSDVIGRTLVVNGTIIPVVGVAPASFQGLFNGGLVPSAMWLSVSTAPLMKSVGVDFRLDSDRDNRWLSVIGRLQPGKTFAQSQAEARVIAGQLDAAYPLGRDLDPKWRRYPELVSRQWTLRPMAEVTKVGNTDQIMPLFVTAVFVAAGLVLLVACTNLANLTMARGTARRHDVAVRLALGATRWRLIREEIAESLCIVVLGGVAGLGVAATLLAMIRTDINLGPAVIHLMPLLDRAAFVVALAAAVLALAVAGLAPAWFSTRADVRTALGADGPSAALPRWRGRRWLIAMQVSVSLALLSLATITADQVRRELHRDTGLSLDRLAVANIDFSGQRVDDTRARQTTEQILAQLAHEPGVTMVAATSGLPFGISNPGGLVTTLDKPLVEDKYYGIVGDLIAATPGGLQTIGVRIVKGRGMTDRDGDASANIAVVSATLARRLFGTIDVVGREVQVQMRRWTGMAAAPPVVTRTIVGVASDTYGRDRQPGGLTVYVPLAQQPWGRLTLIARTQADPATVVSALRRTIAAGAPGIATSEIGTAMAVSGSSDAGLLVVASIAGLFGLFALVLALAGLYGVLSHVVARRTREMGLRVALGATNRQIVRLIVGDGVRPIVAGVVLGLAVGIVGRMALRPIFEHAVPSVDPLAVALAPAAILIAGWLACYLPARRAARVDPNIALRQL